MEHTAINREEFKAKLFQKTQCSIQHDGWACNTCFHSLELGITDDDLHALWLSVLAYRGDYTYQEVEQSPELVEQNIIRLNYLLNEQGF